MGSLLPCSDPTPTMSRSDCSLPDSVAAADTSPDFHGAIVGERSLVEIRCECVLGRRLRPTVRADVRTAVRSVCLSSCANFAQTVHPEASIVARQRSWTDLATPERSIPRCDVCSMMSRNSFGSQFQVTNASCHGRAYGRSPMATRCARFN